MVAREPISDAVRALTRRGIIMPGSFFLVHLLALAFWGAIIVAVVHQLRLVTRLVRAVETIAEKTGT